MKIRQIFAGLNSELRGGFLSSKEIHHSGGKGAYRETALSRLLTTYLPRRYTCGTGDLVSSTGRRSNQCDIVIYDGFNSPPLFYSEDHTVFAARAAFGVIEVKSILTSEELEKAYLNIRSAKLTATEPFFKQTLFGGVFAYSANRSIDAIAQQISNLNRQFSRENRYLIPDIIAILDLGLIESKGNKEHIDILRSGQNTLLHFYVRCLNALNEIDLRPVDLSPYLSLPTIIDGHAVTGHDRYLLDSDNIEKRVFRLSDMAIRRIYEDCQIKGKQKLFDDDELEQVRSGGSLGALVMAKAYVYNPMNKRIISCFKVESNRISGKNEVDPDEFYPKHHIRIDGGYYYIDIDSLDESDFEQNSDMVSGELNVG